MGYNPRKRQEMAEITNFVGASRVVYRGHRASKSARVRKSWAITHENGQKWRNHEFCRYLYSHVPGAIRHRKPPWTRESWVITQENGLKCPKSRVLPTSLESCTGGHKNPRKQLEMAKITSFIDATRVVYSGSQGIKNLMGSKNRGL